MKLRHLIFAIGMTTTTVLTAHAETKIYEVMGPHEYCHKAAKIAKSTMRMFQDGVSRADMRELEQSSPLGASTVSWVYSRDIEREEVDKKEAVDNAYFESYDMCRQELRKNGYDE